MTIEPGVAQFFLDDRLIARQQRLVRRWEPAKLFPEPVLKPDRPWEARILGLFGTVLPQPEGGFRMYYTHFNPPYRHRHLMLAESEDGFRWDKPNLGRVEWKGNRDTNIVTDWDQAFDSPSIVVDTRDKDYPYKLLAFEIDRSELDSWWGPSWGLYAHRSRDGLAWERIPGRRVAAGDRTALLSNLDDGRFVAFTRHPEMTQQTGGRAVYRIESSDFFEWSEPVLVVAPDLADEPDVEFYGMSVFKRNGWYFGLLEYWRSDVDVLDVHLAFSRDGIAWQRPHDRRPFIAAQFDWNRTWTTCASNGAVVIEEQMVFHVGGRWASHHFDTAQQHGVIGYASLPLDRFCALEGRSKGLLETVPIVWPGGELALNADTRESFAAHPRHTTGQIAVEVLDAGGEPLPDWSGENRATFSGNTHARCETQAGIVRWPGDRRLNALRGQTIRLRCYLDHARLYTFEARA